MGIIWSYFDKTPKPHDAAHRVVYYDDDKDDKDDDKNDNEVDVDDDEEINANFELIGGVHYIIDNKFVKDDQKAAITLTKNAMVINEMEHQKIKSERVPYKKMEFVNINKYGILIKFKDHKDYLWFDVGKEGRKDMKDILKAKDVRITTQNKFTLKLRTGTFSEDGNFSDTFGGSGDYKSKRSRKRKVEHTT